MKPVILSGSWVVKAPLNRIYEIVTDFENAPKYFPLVASSLKIKRRNGNKLTIDAIAKTFGIPFKIVMETELHSGRGFMSVNTSALAIEDESFLMEETEGRTKIIYRNEVTIKNNFLKLFAKILIGPHALWFWKVAYIDELEKLDRKSVV